MKTNKQNTLLYMTIFRQLADDIRSGSFQNGDLLPPEKDLMERFRASRTTIRHAISLLCNEKLVTVRQGRGTVVTLPEEDNYTSILKADKFRGITSIQSQTTQSGAIKSQNGLVDLIRASAAIAEKLSISQNDDVYRVRRIKLIDNQPFGYIVSYIPASEIPGFETFSGKISTLYNTLKEAYNIEIVKAKETITSSACSATESLLLNLSPNSPLLLLRRLGYTEHGILEYTESYYDPAKYEIVINMDGIIDYSRNHI